MLDAKARKLKSLRKESDKAKINLLSSLRPACDRISGARQEKRECFRSASTAFAGKQMFRKVTTLS